MKLKCIDTFSGIGGLSSGLRDFTHTIQYCEWDAFCQQVLIERMGEGRLDAAPIHADIKNLHVSPHVQPEMICGGFPCQDISSLGLQKGIVDGERSSMFYHIMRVFDECPSIQVIFLENVSNIVNCGMKEVIEACTQRKLNMQWKIFTAGEMGAPHVRARWFCLVCRPGVDLSTLNLKHKVAHHWEDEPSRRFTYKPSITTDDTYDVNWIQRCQTLGNSVVPQVVREAFVDLATSSIKWEMMADCMSQFATSIHTLSYPYPDSGLIYNGTFYSMPKRISYNMKHSVSITLGGEEQKLGNYPTPRRGLTHASSLTERSIRDLPTILVHCDQTRQLLQEDGHVDDMSKLYTVILPNVGYLEWMMGYAKDWTKIQHTFSKQKSVLTSTPIPSSTTTTSEEEDETHIKNSLSKNTNVGKQKYNGMHALMKENPGKDIKYVAGLWRTLTIEQKREYSEKARLM